MEIETRVQVKGQRQAEVYGVRENTEATKVKETEVMDGRSQKERRAEEKRARILKDSKW